MTYGCVKIVCGNVWSHAIKQQTNNSLIIRLLYYHSNVKVNFHFRFIILVVVSSNPHHLVNELFCCKQQVYCKTVFHNKNSKQLKYLCNVSRPTCTKQDYLC